jgi:hypothetical protein
MKEKKRKVQPDPLPKRALCGEKEGTLCLLREKKIKDRKEVEMKSNLYIMSRRPTTFKFFTSIVGATTLAYKRRRDLILALQVS